MKPIIWVARPDKTGWNATRARDRVDYSFCVYRETDLFPARLVVRETYTDKPGARARKTVGEFVFPTAKQAKGMVNTLLQLLNDETSYPVSASDRNFLRATFMSKMMTGSAFASENKYHAECIWYDDPYTHVRTKPAGSVPIATGTYLPATAFEREEPEALVAAEEEDEVLPPSMFYNADTREWLVSNPVGVPFNSVASVQPLVHQAQGILAEMMGDIIERTAPSNEFKPARWRKGDPVPEGWIAMGDKVVQLSWPK